MCSVMCGSEAVCGLMFFRFSVCGLMFFVDSGVGGKAKINLESLGVHQPDANGSVRLLLAVLVTWSKTQGQKTCLDT